MVIANRPMNELFVHLLTSPTIRDQPTQQFIRIRYDVERVGKRMNDRKGPSARICFSQAVGAPSTEPTG